MCVPIAASAQPSIKKVVEPIFSIDTIVSQQQFLWNVTLDKKTLTTSLGVNSSHPPTPKELDFLFRTICNVSFLIQLL